MRLIRTQVSNIGFPVFMMSRETDEGGNLQIPREIQEITKQLFSVRRSPNVHNEIVGILSDATQKLPGFTQLTPTRYRYQGYYLKTALLENALQNSKHLNMACSLDIKSLPKFIGLIPINEDEAVTIVFYHGSPNEHYIPYDRAKHRVSAPAKRRYVDDMKKLSDLGFWHPYSTQGTKNMFVDSNGDIIIEPWEALTPAHEQDKGEIINEIENILGLNRESALKPM